MERKDATVKAARNERCRTIEFTLPQWLGLRVGRAGVKVP